MIKIFLNFLLGFFMLNSSVALADGNGLKIFPKKSVEKAVAFHDLHKHSNSKLLVLPNVWNPLSAKLFERAGFKAIATTSSGIAASLGYPDGEQLPKNLMFDMVRQIANNVDIPVSMDLETGYGKTPQEICANIQEIIEAGIVGINIEDANPDQPGDLFPIANQVAKIKAIRACAQKTGVPLFINARTDSYWLKLFTPEKRLSETLIRLKEYEKAGADGVFIPGLTDLDIIAELSRNVSIPINLLAGSWIKDTTILAKSGVSRLSIGSLAFRDISYRIQELAEQLNGATSFEFFNESLPYSELNRLLSDSASEKSNYYSKLS